METVWHICKETIKSILLVVILSIVSIFVFWIIQEFSFGNSNFQISVVAVLIAYLIVYCIGTVTSKRFREWLKENPLLATQISIAVPILLFALQVGISIMSDSFAAEDALKQSNHLNTKMTESFLGLNGLPHDDLLWANLDFRAYNDGYGYISKNYSLECKSDYTTLGIHIESFNALNFERRAIKRDIASNGVNIVSLETLDSSYKSEMAKVAEKILSLLNDVIKNCQDFKQNNFL